MSLYRFVYYCAVVGGWAAFLAWMLAELLVLRGEDSGGTATVVLIGAMVGAAIGAGLNLVSGMSNAQWKRQLLRLPSGLIGGGIGGAIGGLLGNLLLVLMGLSRTPGSLSGWMTFVPVLGWIVMGLAIGSAEGIYEQSSRKCRNGAIGGAIGGLLGGIFMQRIASGSGMAARATAFVVLGISIGALIGLAQLVLKEAWLTVVDGFRPGRELILGQTVTALGRGDHLPLPFLGYPGRDLESEHARITRQTDGNFVLEDNRSRLGTRLNGQPIQAATALKDGDLIKLGSNIVRFSHRGRGAVHVRGGTPASIPAGSMAPPPLPPMSPMSRPPVMPAGVKPPMPPPPSPPPPAMPRPAVPLGGPRPPGMPVGQPPPPPSTPSPAPPRIPPPPPPPAAPPGPWR